MNKKAAAVTCISTMPQPWLVQSTALVLKAEKQRCVFMLIKICVCVGGGQDSSVAEHSPGILEVLGKISSAMSKTQPNQSRNK